MAWYHIVGIAVVAWFGLSVLLAGAWSRFASRRTAREQQILADRCDRCGAQALHAFAHTMTDGGYVILMFCNHHARSHHNATRTWAAHHDYRMPMDAWEKEAAAQKQKAIRDGSGKTDPHPPTPPHLSQWDLDRWA